MEEIYNRRPHRLKADIEEHSTEKTKNKRVYKYYIIS